MNWKKPIKFLLLLFFSFLFSHSVSASQYYLYPESSYWYGSTSSEQVISTSSLISYWKLDNNSNDSISSNHGTDTNISYGTDYGLINQGALFSGTSMIELPDIDSILGSNPDKYTVNFWFKTTNTASKQSLISDYHGGPGDSNYGMDIAITQTNCYLQAGIRSSGNTYEFTGSTNYCDGNWHFVVLTVDKNSLKMNTYVDGSVIDANRTIGNYDYIDTVPLAIGSFYYGSFTQYFSGSMDEIGLWTTALSSSTVHEMYDEQKDNYLSYPFTIFSTTTLFSVSSSNFLLMDINSSSSFNMDYSNLKYIVILLIVLAVISGAGLIRKMLAR